MEVAVYGSEERSMWVASILEAMVVETLLDAGKSLALLFMASGSLLNDVGLLPNLTAMDGRFPFDELHKLKRPVPENKDASDTEDDDDDEDDDEVDDQDGDAGDEDFSGGEGEDEGDPEDNPEANGEGGSDDEDDDEDDDDGDDEEDEDEDGEEEEEEEEEEVPQPPAKKKK
ncbi:hypothetical protein FNV43_RR03489 [Rhamnella rubrinervis]|uniref:Uncharacterized protein n=1 Tax=Rhamnella rubrinervis TaxID=2594499 RepID=A0A8K0HII3_9ROSA|nr:hypothetical protein FNV43_RR03489 [Rhamnella rubrinervis]